MPVLGSCVRRSREKLAVEMIFHPLVWRGIPLRVIDGEPLGLIGWQGIVPAKAGVMAERMVDMVTTQLVDVEEVKVSSLSCFWSRGDRVLRHLFFHEASLFQFRSTVPHTQQPSLCVCVCFLKLNPIVKSVWAISHHSTAQSARSTAGGQTVPKYCASLFR